MRSKYFCRTDCVLNNLGLGFHRLIPNCLYMKLFTFRLHFLHAIHLMQILAASSLQLLLSSLRLQPLCTANSSVAFHQRRSSVSLSCQVPLLCCHLSTFVHPVGMLLLPLVSGNALGHVNVFSPVARVPVPFTQFVVAFVGFHAVKLTSIDARLLHL